MLLSNSDIAQACLVLWQRIALLQIRKEEFGISQDQKDAYGKQIKNYKNVIEFIQQFIEEV